MWTVLIDLYLVIVKFAVMGLAGMFIQLSMKVYKNYMEEVRVWIYVVGIF